MTLFHLRYRHDLRYASPHLLILVGFTPLDQCLLLDLPPSREYLILPSQVHVPRSDVSQRLVVAFVVVVIDLLCNLRFQFHGQIVVVQENDNFHRPMIAFDFLCELTVALFLG